MSFPNMLMSLPPIHLHDAHNLWHPSVTSHSYAPSPSSHDHPDHTRTAQHRQNSHSNPPPRTPLSILLADERAIELRKLHIQRFGATWLKPPGVSKTLQGMDDERAEREEQEATGLRELEALDAEQARLLEAQARANDADASILSSDSEEEHDLDDDIPDGDNEEQEWLDDDADDALPTDEGDGDYAEAQGVGLDDGITGGRNLDDDVPEAGSYQHTDTDLEDSDSEMDMGGRDSFGGTGGRANMRTSAFTSLFGGSSSPVVPQSGGGRGRRSGGLGRGTSREN